MKSPPASYTGWDQYCFVAYSRRDSEIIHEEIRWLQDQGFRIAYDEGINPGSAWSDAIAERIQYCDRFIYFLSVHSVVSEHCRRELNFALEEEKEVLAIYLDDTSVPAGIRLLLNNRQAINRHVLDASSYQRKLRNALGQTQVSIVKTQSAVETPSEPDRIHILVGQQHGHENQYSAEAVSYILRHLSWQSGVFRAHDQRSAPRVRDASAYYELQVQLSTTDDEIDWSWQVFHSKTGEVIWASHQNCPAAGFHKGKDHISERITEGTLKAITDFELNAIRGRSLHQLTFSQLILKSGQLNYLDRADLVERTNAIELARAIEPFSGIPLAAMASLLSWKLINGISEDDAADLQLLSDEARKALRLDGNDPYVLLNIGTTYCRIGKHDSGLSLIRRAFAMTPTLTARDQLARCLCFAGQPEEAITHFKEILSATPAGIAFPYVRLAVAQAQAGQLEEALEHASLSTTSFPDDYYGWFVQANLLAQLGYMDQARECVIEGRRLSPQLDLETIIEKTASTYARTDEQRTYLTAGLRSLANESL